MKITVTNIQRFCMHDGPGIRTTVFLKGCPLRCRWCHNPETQSAQQQILFDPKRCIACGACQVCPQNAHAIGPEEGHCFLRKNCVACGACVEHCSSGALTWAGRTMTCEEILSQVEKDRAFYGKQGGMTLSGGEPMLFPEHCITLLRMAKERGISTALETSGFFSSEYLMELVPLVDCFLWDFKDSNSSRHLQNTGVELATIVENIRIADRLGGKIRLRCILLHGVNCNEEHIAQVARLKNSLANCIGVDFLPYHPMGSSKYTLLGKIDTFDKEDYIPSKEEMAWANERLAELLQ